MSEYIKAISLWQPWATAIACGAKRIETRGWETRYRGQVLIHAATRMIQYEMRYHNACWNWRAVLAHAGHPTCAAMPGCLPFGKLLAIADLTDCVPTEQFGIGEIEENRGPKDEPPGEALFWTERSLGDFTAGRFGWVLTNVRKFQEPVKFRGAQGLFDVPRYKVADEIRRAIPVEPARA